MIILGQIHSKIFAFWDFSPRALPEPRVIMTLKRVAASTAAMEAPASLAARVQSVCVHHPLLGRSVSIPLTLPVIPTPVTTVAPVNTYQSRLSTTAPVLQTSTACDATSWIIVSQEAPATPSHRRQRWRSNVRSHSVKVPNTISFAMPSVTTTSAAGTTATAPSTSTTRGRTARPRCSAGDTLMMENAIHSAITLDASTMGLTARIWRDSASEFIYS